jgi:hypothetical protein
VAFMDGDNDICVGQGGGVERSRDEVNNIHASQGGWV